MSKKKKLIYISPAPATFVKKDIDFLSKEFHVVSPKHIWIDGRFLMPIRLIQQFFFLLWHAPKCKGMVIMFAGYWSLLPAIFGKILRKKVFIILGGTDCVAFPELNYGTLRKRGISWFIKWSCKWCTKLLPVHESLIYSDYTYSERSTHKAQGIKYFFPDINTPFEVIHNGYDGTEFIVEQEEVKEPLSFVVLAVVNSEMRLKLKGLDVVKDLSKYHSNCIFNIIGIEEQLGRRHFTDCKNVRIHPFLSTDKFKKILHKSEFVLQLSVSEGFPNSLCEAMLCGCIPVGSSVGAIPFIISETGFVIESSNFEYINQRFNEIINLSKEEKQELSKKALQRILNEFPIEKRANRLLELLTE
jgi:glycosyltransferase involved in cell wall biosynthesis